MHVARRREPHVPMSPYHWANSEGLELRLQVFLTVRNAKGEVALVREKDDPDKWRVPGETLKPNEPVDDAARRVAALWFERDLEPWVSRVLTWPDEGEGKWYIVMVYEAHEPEGGLGVPADTEEVRFVMPGTDPGPFGMSHGDIWERIEP